jgi:hypothetical protein
MKLFQSVVQFNPAKLQAGGGSGLGLWSKWCILYYIKLYNDIIYICSCISYNNTT